MDAQRYADVWKREASLESLNLDIHDGAPLGELANRGRGLRDLMFDRLFPGTAPATGASVLEFGSGVGWIMEAMVERFSLRQIVGLDISLNMARHARQRFPHPRASLVVYDGMTFPFPSDRFDTLYSLSAIQHVEKHAAFLLFREMYRVLKPGGHAILQVLSVHHMARAHLSYEVECRNHVTNAEVYWHHYYAFDELVVLFSELIGVDDLDIVPAFDTACFFLHFSKGTGRRFLRPELLALTYPERVRELGEAPQAAGWWSRLRRAAGA